MAQEDNLEAGAEQATAEGDNLEARADRIMERLTAAQGDDAPFQQADPLELAARLSEVAAAQDDRPEPSPVKATEPSPAGAPAATDPPAVADAPDGAARAALATKPAPSTGRKSRGGGARRASGSRKGSRPGSAVAEAAR